jgi:hypothetical protein
MPLCSTKHRYSCSPPYDTFGHGCCSCWNDASQENKMSSFLSHVIIMLSSSVVCAKITLQKVPETAVECTYFAAILKPANTEELCIFLWKNQRREKIYVVPRKELASFAFAGVACVGKIG